MYFGEISGMGDSVKIIKEPEVAIQPYARGTQMTSQDLLDSDFTLIVDRANAFQFQIDDIEIQQAHVGWMDMASDRASYRLKDAHEIDVLSYLAGYEKLPGSSIFTPRTAPVGTNADASAGVDELLASHKLTRRNFVGGLTGGAEDNSIVIGVNGTYDATPLQVLNRIARLMDQQNIDKEGRWVVVDPVFLELLSDENSKFINNDYAANQDAGGILRNGRVGNGPVRGFRLYSTNNAPYVGLGSDVATAGGSDTNFGLIIAGHDSAVATAQQISKTESFRSKDSFADVVRGLHVYGRKILRPEALFTAAWNRN